MVRGSRQAGDEVVGWVAAGAPCIAAGGCPVELGWGWGGGGGLMCRMGRQGKSMRAESGRQARPAAAFGAGPPSLPAPRPPPYPVETRLVAHNTPLWPVQVHGLVVDEASLTGESDPVKKGGDRHEPWVRSGTQVSTRTPQGAAARQQAPGHWLQRSRAVGTHGHWA